MDTSRIFPVYNPPEAHPVELPNLARLADQSSRPPCTCCNHRACNSEQLASEHFVTRAHENLNKQSLNALIITAAILISPLWAMSQIPTVARKPLLRIVTYVTCISCVAALATSFILRVRLQYITSWAKASAVHQGMPNGQTIMTVSSVPLALLLSTIALFTFVLLGFTFETGSQIPVDLVADTGLTSVEQIILIMSGTLAFVGTCSTTVASFVPEHEPEDYTVDEKAADLYA